MCDMNFFSPGANKMRFVAIPCLIFGVLQISYAASAAAVVTHEIVGSWWAGLIILITTIFTGMKATNMCSVVSAIIFGIISIVAAIVACFIDAILSAHFNQLKGCVGNGKLYGEIELDGASECGMSYDENQCLCWEEDDWNTECYVYDINGEDYDCGYLLDEVPANLTLSAWFAGISIITMIVYSCMACGVTCCTETCGHYDPSIIESQKQNKEAADAAAIQRVAQLQQQQQQQQVYQGQPGQPQMVYPGQVQMQQQPQVVYPGQVQMQQQQNPVHPGQMQMQQQPPPPVYPGLHQPGGQPFQPQGQQQQVYHEEEMPSANPIQTVPVTHATAPQAKPLPP